MSLCVPSLNAESVDRRAMLANYTRVVVRVTLTPSLTVFQEAESRPQDRTDMYPFMLLSVMLM